MKSSIALKILCFIISMSVLSGLTCCTNGSAKSKPVTSKPVVKKQDTKPKPVRVINTLILDYADSYQEKQGHHRVLLADECQLLFDQKTGLFMIQSDNVTLMREVARQLDSVKAYYFISKPVDCITIKYYKTFIPKLN